MSAARLGRRRLPRPGGMARGPGGLLSAAAAPQALAPRAVIARSTGGER